MGRAKYVQQLYQEIEKKETVLIDKNGVLLRTVTALFVFIYDNHGNILIFDKQQFKDGRIRERNIPLAEKMFPGEDWKQATVRAITEELGSVLHYQPIVGFNKNNTQKSASDSYPELITIYENHYVAVHVYNLPPQSFESYEEHLTSYWK